MTRGERSIQQGTPLMKVSIQPALRYPSSPRNDEGKKVNQGEAELLCISRIQERGMIITSAYCFQSR